MKLLNVLALEKDSVVITYHWDRVNSENDFCPKVKSLKAVSKDEPSGPSAVKALAAEVATLVNGVEIIQGPWLSRDHIRETLIDLIEKSHPELNQTFRLCRDCLC